MALNVRERWLFGGAALIALVVIGWLVLARHATPPPATAPEMLAPIELPTPPTGDAAFRRALFAPAALVAEAPPADAPALTGIVGRIDADAVALVRTSIGETRTLKPGEAVDGWTLQSLAIDAAYFTRGSSRVRVPLPAGEEDPSSPVGEDM